MNRGDLFTVYLDGVMLTVCVVGTYYEEYSGEEIAILAVVSQDNLVHVPLQELNALFPAKKFMH
ncbi:MAG: hypothetical protein ACOX0N_11840 [Syntrophomonadaceae bacterium]|nr:hypothetical protein [Syntrophomonadaceae bacterium]